MCIESVAIRRDLTGCEEPHSGMSRHVQHEANYKVPLFLLCLIHSQKLRPFVSEESLLQEVKPCIQRPAEDQER